MKAQESPAYARRVKLTNLQQMAKTVAYIQEHGYDSEEALADAFSQAQAQTSDMRKALRSTEKKLKEVNQQIHYTGQYLANKSVYKQYLASRNKKQFRQEHGAKIALYEAARKFLKDSAGGGKLPSIKLLKEEKAKLTEFKNRQYEAYQNLRGYEKELKTVKTNVEMILGKGQDRQEQERETSRS